MPNIHHTKTKADIGLTKVIAALTTSGCTPCVPLSEHQPYDLVAVLPSGRMVKLQVKYAKINRGGVEIKFQSSWADKNGTHSRRYKTGDFDYYAIYCPHNEQVLYVPNKKHCPKFLRFEKPGNGQRKHIRWADHYGQLVK